MEHSVRQAKAAQRDAISENAVAQSLAAMSRWRLAEAGFWGFVAACYFAFPHHRSIMSEIAILAMFALSLDLILGYAGIVSLGHAAFFGFGAYTAGLFALHVTPDPFFGLALATLLSAVLRTH